MPDSLLDRAQRGDRLATNRLIEEYMPLVQGVVGEFVRRKDSRRDDLIQEGCIGLYKALAQYDPDRGAKFSTYAVWWVKACVRRYLRRQGTNVADLSLNFKSDGEAGQDDELGDRLPAELPDPVEGIENDELRATVRGVAESVARRLDRRAYCRSSDGQQHLTILVCRWLSAKPRTLQEVGDQIHCSRERVRQIEVRLLERMADIFRAQGLESLVEA